jgi:hypothetical protein
MLQNLQLVVGKRYESESERKRMNKPLFSVVMDEFAPVGSRHFAQILNTARGTNTAFLFSMQSLPQLLQVGKGFQQDVPRGFAGSLFVDGLVRAGVLEKRNFQSLFQASHKQTVQLVEGNGQSDAFSAFVEFELNRLVRNGVEEEEGLPLGKFPSVVGIELKELRARQRPKQVDLHRGQGQLHRSGRCVGRKKTQGNPIVDCGYQGLPFSGIFGNKHRAKIQGNAIGKPLFIQV